jgi:hypothetical protein
MRNGTDTRRIAAKKGAPILSGLHEFVVRRDALRSRSLPDPANIERARANMRAFRSMVLPLAVFLLGVVPFTIAHSVAAAGPPAEEPTNLTAVVPASESQIFVLQVTEHGCSLIEKVQTVPSQQSARIAGATYVYLYADELNDAFAELCGDHINQ